MIIPNYNDGTIDVYLDAKDLGRCQELATTFSKLGEWGELNTYGGGIGNSTNDKKRVERTGALGEKAFCKLTGFPMNEDYKANGDDGFDFAISSFSMDIKCQMRYYEQAVDWGFYGEFFTKAHLENGVYVPPRSDVIVFSSVFSGDSWTENYGKDWDEVGVDSKNSNNLIIKFYGAISSKKIFSNYQERLGSQFQRGGPNAQVGDFKNYYINKKELLPMLDFLNKYKNELLTSKSDIII